MPQWLLSLKLHFFPEEGVILVHHLDSGLTETCVPGKALSGPDVRVLVPHKG